MHAPLLRFFLMQEPGLPRMTVPGMFGSAFGTFLLRQFFITIPTDFDDAATIHSAAAMPDSAVCVTEESPMGVPWSRLFPN